MRDSANAIVVIGKRDPPVFAMCVVLAATRLDVNKTVRKAAGHEEGVVRQRRRHRGDDRHGDRRRDTVRSTRRPADLGGRGGDGRERIVVGGGSRACKVVGPPAMLLELGAVEIVEGLAADSVPTASDTAT